ncbi:hypothetical protein SH661x_002052 [Planctomicrobium sp. SH661]|uniref:hypothetical protein n=1 Tax=Planctomicrobium sp. SH661 TaxID=3448124 RepID=UPI003F5B2F4B
MKDVQLVCAIFDPSHMLSGCPNLPVPALTFETEGHMPFHRLNMYVNQIAEIFEQQMSMLPCNGNCSGDDVNAH